MQFRTFRSTRRFSHLRSRWAMPLWWQYSTPSHICRNHDAACFSGMLFWLCSRCSRLPPVTSSMMMYTRVLVSIACNDSCKQRFYVFFFLRKSNSCFFFKSQLCLFSYKTFVMLTGLSPWVTVMVSRMLNDSDISWQSDTILINYNNNNNNNTTPTCKAP